MPIDWSRERRAAATVGVFLLAGLSAVAASAAVNAYYQGRADAVRGRLRDAMAAHGIGGIDAFASAEALRVVKHASGFAIPDAEKLWTVHGPRPTPAESPAYLLLMPGLGGELPVAVVGAGSGSTIECRDAGEFRLE